MPSIQAKACLEEQFEEYDYEEKKGMLIILALVKTMSTRVLENNFILTEFKSG